MNLGPFTPMERAKKENWFGNLIPEALDAISEDFGATGVNRSVHIITMYHFGRLMREGGRIKERYSIEDSRDQVGCGWSCFIDHALVFKRGDDKCFLITLPYSDEHYVKLDFYGHPEADYYRERRRAKGFNECAGGGLAIAILPDKYKFRPNGDMAVLISSEKLMQSDFSDLVKNGEVLP